jgi:hypothetical protein
LGRRHNELSCLTLYESLPIARIHAVISVLICTGSGQMCYAGHITNYYQKILEWHHGLPAVLAGKMFFLVKRRKSLRVIAGTPGQQKKRTTANRSRLIDAICKVVQTMPRVYKHSFIDLDALRQQTSCDDSAEMEPQEQDAPDLSSDVLLSAEVVRDWIDAAKRGMAAEVNVLSCPCGAYVFVTARDVQVGDVRGSLPADMAWKYCCSKY